MVGRATVATGSCAKKPRLVGGIGAIPTECRESRAKITDDVGSPAACRHPLVRGLRGLVEGTYGRAYVEDDGMTSDDVKVQNGTQCGRAPGREAIGCPSQLELPRTSSTNGSTGISGGSPSFGRKDELRWAARVRERSR